MKQPLAFIHPDAKIGKDVIIEPFTTINKNVEIGEGTWISSNVTIMEGARIGKNCRIFPGAVISAIPQDLKFGGEESIARIGDHTTIRECVTINRGTSASGETLVGDHCLLMAYSHVAHDCIIGNHCIIANSVGIAGHVEIGDYAILGGLCAVHQFVKVGAHSMISGGTLIRKDIPPYVKAAKEPVSFIGINSIGLKRRKFTVEKISEIQKIYRKLFQSEKNISQAVTSIQKAFNDSEEKNEILNFIKSSKRGIMKGYLSK